MKIVQLLIVSLLLFSCGNTIKDSDRDIVAKKKFISETIMVDDTEFPFQHDSIALILEKVGLCKIVDSIVPDTIPPCDYKLFRYFSNSQEPFRNGFIVEVKPKVWSDFFLVVCIAKNKAGVYYKSNAVHGQLLELRTTPNGHYDMVVRYLDAEVGTVAILHKWNKTKYDPVQVLEINDHFVKPEKQDSLNDVYLKDFVWGY